MNILAEMVISRQRLKTSSVRCHHLVFRAHSHRELHWCRNIDDPHAVNQRHRPRTVNWSYLEVTAKTSENHSRLWPHAEARCSSSLLEHHDHPHWHKCGDGNRKGERGQVTVPSRTLPEEQPEHLTISPQSKWLSNRWRAPRQGETPERIHRVEEGKCHDRRTSPPRCFQLVRVLFCFTLT